MNRRQFLEIGCPLLGVSLTGCVSNSTETSDDDPARVIAVESASANSDDPEIAFDAEVMSPQMDGANPPQVRTTVTNQSDRDVLLEGGNHRVFGVTLSENNEGLWFIPGGSEDSGTRTDEGCWMIEPPVDRVQVLRHTLVNSGASESINSAIYGYTKTFAMNCPEKETYRFTQPHTVVEWNSASEDRPRKELGEVVLRFAVAVTSR